MSEAKKNPSIEEFTKAVKGSFKAGCPNLSNTEIDRYFATDEAQDVIKTQYKEDKDKKCLLYVAASAAGSCLALMY